MGIHASSDCGHGIIMARLSHTLKSWHHFSHMSALTGRRNWRLHNASAAHWLMRARHEIAARAFAHHHACTAAAAAVNGSAGKRTLATLVHRKGHSDMWPHALGGHEMRLWWQRMDESPRIGKVNSRA